MSHPNEPGIGQLREPPHSVEAEMSVLGALLIDNQAFDRVSWLSQDAFYRDQHRRIWAVLVRLLEAGRGADITTVSNALGDDLEKAGGLAYLGALAQNVPSAFNIRRYAELVAEKWIARQLITQAMNVADQAFSPVVDAKQLAEEAGAAFLAIQVDQRPSEMAEFGQALVEAVEWADNPSKGLPTGYAALDKMLHGLTPGDLFILAGRPSMGKSALAMNIAEHVARNQHVAVFSLEMTRRKIAGRVLKYHESLTSRDEAVDHLSTLKLHIDDSSAVTLGHLRIRLSRLKRRHGLGLVVIDYLQLLTAKAEKREQEISAISRGLKAIAKDFEVPVIAVAQLNRGAEARLDHRPMLSDLRESGQIEQDADVIAFVYRDEYYRPDSAWKGIAEVIVRKSRDGAIGTAYLTFVPELTRFKALDRELPKPPEKEPTAPRRTVVKGDFKRAAAGDK